MAKGAGSGLRLLRAERCQVSWGMACLDDLIEPGHRVRLVWAYVEELDLSGLYGNVKSVAGDAGRPAIDPAVLMALWLMATLEDIGSARHLAELCRRDIVYRWLLGGIEVSHKTLSDFRTGAGPVLDALLSRAVAALAAAKLIDMDCLAIDGMRLRASAGASSFRSAERLEELMRAAEAKVAALRDEVENDGGASGRRTQTRRLRAAEDRTQRIAEAREAADAIAAGRAEADRKARRQTPAKPGKVRASTSDPQARIMRMADGGYRPAYNVRFQTEPSSGLVVGVSVGGNASDRGQLGPAVAEIEARYGTRPRRLLADSGYDAKCDIEALAAPEAGAVEVFCPWPSRRGGGPLPVTAKDGPGVKAWAGRMASEEGQKLYAKRIQAERPHADMRNRGLKQVMVRGMEKVKAAVLWHVHAHNFLTAMRLKAQAS